jgi:hypothetical protein
VTTNVNPNWIEQFLNAARTALNVTVTANSPTGASANQVQGAGAAGAALVGQPVQIGGSDGTNTRVPKVSAAGLLSVAIADGDQQSRVALQTDVLYSGSTALTPATAFADVAASSTDAVLVTAVGGKIIRVLQLFAQDGATATTFTLNSKGAGVGTAIACQMQNGSNCGEVLPFSPVGWIDTTVSQGLTVTTGAGSTTGFLIKYVLV